MVGTHEAMAEDVLRLVRRVVFAEQGPDHKVNDLIENESQCQQLLKREVLRKRW